MATTNKNFKVKNGLEVGGNGTFDGAVSAQSFNVPSPRTNLVINPNFETNLTGWGVDDESTLVRTSTNPKNGTWCAQADYPTFLGYTAGAGTLISGVSYTVSLWVRIDSGTKNISFSFYGGSTTSESIVSVGTSWTQITSTVVAGGSGVCYITLRPASGSDYAVTFVDSVIVETTSSYEGFFDGNTPGAAWTGTANASTSTTTGTGTVSVANLSGATFAGNVTAPNFNGNVALANVTGLGFNVSTFLASPSSTNLLNAVTDESGTGTLVFSTSPVLTTPNIGAAIGTSVNVTGNVTANLITAPSVSATSVSAQSFSTAAFTRTNLVANPNFETNATDWTAFYGSVSRVSTTPQTGSWCLAATPDEDGDLGPIYTRANALTVGTSYRAGIWVRIASGTFGMRLTLEAGASSSFTNFTATTSWQFVQVGPVTATSNGNLQLRVTPPNTYAGFSGTLFADSAIVELSSTYNGTFFDGNTPDTSIVDYAWTGTANASTSTATGSAVGLATLAGGTFTGNIAGTNISMSGNVNAVTVNATTLIGNTNASTITTGTIANARTSANSANGASTIVARDANGSFAANVVSATTFSGSGASLTSIPNSSLVNNSITINGNAVALGGNITIAGSSGNSFETISANGTSVVADSSTDTLTITPGSGMSIVGNATSDTVTFSVDYAEKIYYLVRNNTGSTIPKGTLVSASGAEPSGRIDVAPHSTTGTQDSELRVMGMATANISNGVNGEVISFGTLVGIDTRGDTASAIAVGDETWAEGDILYAHPTVAGKLTKVRPQHDLAVAFITIRHASTGQIAVRIIPGNHHLEWLHDVAIDGTPADNELLAYNSASSLWINQTAEEAGVANLSGATFTGNVAGTNISMSGNVNAQSFLTPFTRTNLITNPNLETNVAGWASGYSGTDRVTENPQSGTYSVRAMTNGEDPYVLMQYTQANAVVIGTSYRAGVWVRIESGTAPITVDFYFGNGANRTVYFTATTSWQFIEAPATTAAGNTTFQMSVSGDNVTLFVDSLILELTSTYTGTFFDGNTPDANGIDYAWTGTANASTSGAIGSIGVSYLSGANNFTGDVKIKGAYVEPISPFLLMGG